MKIRTKLTLLFCLVIIIVVSIFSVLFFRQSQEGIKSRIVAQLESVAILKEHSLNNLIGDGINDIKIISDSKTIKGYKYNSYQEVDNFLKEILPQTIFSEIRIISLDGREEYSTHFSKKYYRTEKYFVEGKKGIFVQSFYYDVDSKRISTAVSGPIHGAQGELVGVIVGVVDPNRISEVMLETSGLGKTGETYLVNKFNYVVTELKNKKSAVDIALYSNVVKDCLKGNAGFSLYENYVNKPVVGFYRWIPNLEVCLLAEMDQEEAFEPVSNLKKNVTTLSILIILGVSLLAILFSGTLTKPISQLHKATEQLMKGDFTAKTNIKSGDEIEDLGRAFNKTVDTLKVIDEERKQIDKAKTEFLSITSHELRSPMTPMKAQLQMLLEGYFGELNDKQKESLKIILKNADRLDNLIVDFLEISRIEAGRLTFVFQKTDLSVDIKETVDYMQSLCLDKKIKISLKMDELPVIEVDPNRVMQVLRNLLDNAIKFSNPNSKIEVAVKKKKDHLLFSVKDYGIGISVEDQPKLFQPFFRAEKTLYRQYSGTGLGLAICKGIVESQNGKIWVESESGKGSTFYFTVPFKPVKEIKPITLLFFQTERIEAQLRDLFSNVLGPLGEHTFEELKSKNELNKPKLLEYTNYLLKEGVLSEEKSIYMKNMIKSIFGEKVEAKTAIKKIKRWVDIF